MRKKIIGIICAAALIMGLSSGCATNSNNGSTEESGLQNEQIPADTAQEDITEAEKITIRFATNWGPGDAKYDYFNPLFEKYAEENKEKVVIKLETLSTEDYKTKIRTETASGNLPDIFTWWGGSMITDMVDAELLLNVDDYFMMTDKTSKEDFDSSAFGYYTLPDGTYGFPLESTRPVFIANKALFDEYGLSYPKTYEELKAVSEVFNQNGIIPIAMASKNGTPAEFFFSELYSQFAGAEEELVNMGTTRNFATDNALKTAEAITDMINQGMFPEDTVANGDWGPCLQLYCDGKAAMTYTYPWMFESMTEEAQEFSECIPVPMLDGAANDPSTFVSGFTVYGAVVSKSSFEDPAKQQALVDFIDFLTSDELTLALTQSGMIPAKQVAYDMDDMKPIFKKMIDFCEGKKLTSVHYTTIPDLTALNMLDASLDELFIQAITPQEFLDKVQAELDK